MSKISKKIFWVIYDLFAKKMPPSHSYISLGSKRIRYFLVKHFVDKCGKNVNIEKNANISTKICIGNNSDIGTNAKISPYVYIGDNVMMGPDVNIYTRNHKFSDINIPMIEQGYEDYKEVIIGNDVWIGSRVTILPGVKIGDGVVIGASSVVTKDIPAYCVVGGNPARVLKNRKKGEKDGNV